MTKAVSTHRTVGPPIAAACWFVNLARRLTQVILSAAVGGRLLLRDLDQLVAALAVQRQRVGLRQLSDREEVGPLLLGGAVHVAKVGLAEAGRDAGQRALGYILHTRKKKKKKLFKKKLK